MISYFTLKFLKYLQFYCNSSEELLWPSIPARRSLLSLSDIFSEGPSLFARVTEIGYRYFFLSGPPVTSVSEEQPQPSSSKIFFPRLNLLDWAAGEQVQTSWNCRMEWCSALLLPGQALLLLGYCTESGQHQLQCLLCLSFQRKH